MEVILYYKYVELQDVEAAIEEQVRQCTELGLSGRMRMASEGINGTLFGPREELKKYQDWMEESGVFEGIQYKVSAPETVVGEGGEVKTIDPFHGALNVKKCREITSTGLMEQSKPTSLGGQGGVHLNPDEFHEILKKAETDENVVVLDTRNHYETAVGTFKNAVDPKIRCFSQFPSWLESNKDMLKGKQVAMFCTGGIRCEKASAYVKNLNVASDVYQLQGGIHSYLERFSESATQSGLGTRFAKEDDKTHAQPQEECLYEGINFQFDDRFSKPVVGEGKDVKQYHASKCQDCGQQWNVTRKQVQCVVCKDFVLICDKCIENYSLTPLFRAEFPIPENSIRCFEHQLLADNWEEYMAKRNLTSDELRYRLTVCRNLVKAATEKQKNYRTLRKRVLTIQKQATRLEQLLAQRGEAVEDTGEENGEQKKMFTPFVPML
mmetsp:Transcript_36660/g.59131  ORF Transcript_36660/g.59131 Transcript_36660/m.59131 type:complete len:437 (+) Transcript_36660:189-1499(+)